jgi:hypothetical protein
MPQQASSIFPGASAIKPSSRNTESNLCAKQARPVPQACPGLQKSHLDSVDFCQARVHPPNARKTCNPMRALRADSNLSRNETVVCPEVIQLAGIDTASAGQVAPVRGLAVRGVWFDKSQRYPGEIFEVLDKPA